MTYLGNGRHGEGLPAQTDRSWDENAGLLAHHSLKLKMQSKVYTLRYPGTQEPERFLNPRVESTIR